MDDVDYELTAGEELVHGEFSGADCDGGRVVLRERKPVCERACVHVRIDSKGGNYHHPSRRVGYHPALSNAVFAHVLMGTPAPTPPTSNETILTAIVSSCDVRFVDFEGSAGPRRTVGRVCYGRGN